MVTIEAKVDYEIRETVAWITLNRPQKLNALAGDMREQFLSHVKAAGTDDTVRSLVVIGAGNGFCAGGDIDHMVELQANSDEAGFRQLLQIGNEAILALQAFPGLTVAAVNGIAAGAGLSLALACDLRFATPEAKFSAPWIKLGLVPDWGASFWLPRLVGIGKALEIVTSGAAVNAEQADKIGLITGIVSEENFQTAVQDRVIRLGAARQAMAHTKRLIRLGSEDSLEAAMARETESQEECFETEDFKEGLDAFLEKRRALFEDK